MALNCRDELDTARKRQPEIEAVAMEFREEKNVNERVRKPRGLG